MEHRGNKGERVLVSERQGAELILLASVGHWRILAFNKNEFSVIRGLYTEEPCDLICFKQDHQLW